MVKLLSRRACRSCTQGTSNRVARHVPSQVHAAFHNQERQIEVSNRNP
jgi:hypothetical protein